MFNKQLGRDHQTAPQAHVQSNAAPVRQPFVMFAVFKRYLNLIFLSTIFSAAQFSSGKHFVIFFCYSKFFFLIPKMLGNKVDQIHLSIPSYTCAYTIFTSQCIQQYWFIVKESSVLIAITFWHCISCSRNTNAITVVEGLRTTPMCLQGFSCSTLL